MYFQIPAIVFVCFTYMLMTAKHLGHVIHKHPVKFLPDFKRCVYEDRSEVLFIQKWQELLIEYNLKENQWMENLFRVRKKWAAVYRASFTADMNSTQRSEGTPLQLSSSEIPATDEGTPETKINKVQP